MERESFTKQGCVILTDGNYAQWNVVVKKILQKEGVWYTISEGVQDPEKIDDPQSKADQVTRNSDHHDEQLEHAGKMVVIQRMIAGAKALTVSDTKMVSEHKVNKDQAAATALLVTAMDAHNVARVQELEHPAYVWNTIKGHHANRTNQNVANLTDKIRNCLQEEFKTMTEYLNTQRTTFDALVRAGGTLAEEGFCQMVLSNLEEEYDAVSGVMMANPKGLKWADLEVALQGAANLQTMRKRRRNKTKQASKEKLFTKNDMEAVAKQAVAKALKKHGAPSKRPWSQDSAPGECYRWRDTGECRFGKNCKFLHVGPGGKKAKASKTKARDGDASSSSDSDQ
jgi:hypothetical protein